MQVDVVLEPVPSVGYRAKSDVFSVSAEGATEEEALERIKQLLSDRVAAGARLVTLNFPKYSHPASKFFGKLEKDPL